MQKVHRQITVAHRRSGMSLADFQAALKKESGLDLSIPSISRKLNGKRKMTDRELAAFARALGIEVSVTRTVVTLGKAA